MDFKPVQVVVLGDVMVDEYVDVELQEAKEEYSLVGKVNAVRQQLGGAGNVAANIAGMGPRPLLLGVVGDDNYAAVINQLCEDGKIDSFLFRSPGRKTPVKKRFCSTHGTHLLRVDHEDDYLHDFDTGVGLLSACVKHFVGRTLARNCDEQPVAVISDYAKGFCRYEIIQGALQLLSDANVPILVDPPRSGRFGRYCFPQTLFKLNLRQALDLLNDMRPGGLAEVFRNCPHVSCISRGAEYAKSWDVDYVVDGYTELFKLVREAMHAEGFVYGYLWITLGSGGSVIGDRSPAGEPNVFLAPMVLPVSCVGAGDAALAVMAAHIQRCGYSPAAVREGARLATLAASHACTRKGTCQLTAADINKIRDSDEMEG